LNVKTNCDTHDLLSCDCEGRSQTSQEPISTSVHRMCQLGAPTKRQQVCLTVASTKEQPQFRSQ